MGTQLIDNFLKGFNAMEDHDDREFRRQRLSDLDKKSDKRYQDSLAHRDKQTKFQQEKFEHQKEQDKIRNEQSGKERGALSELRADQQKFKEDQEKWRRNQEKEQKSWGLIAPQLPVIHEQFLETGQLPAQAKQFFAENPEYGDYNPETYLDPAYRQNVDKLYEATTAAIKSGKIETINSPEYLEMFNGAFQSKTKQGIGEYNHVLDATVIDKKVAKLIPVNNNKITIGLEVTYQKPNGETFTEVQPMTNGRTSEKGDPVKQFDIKELFSGLETRKRMAYIAENRDKLLERSAKTVGTSKGRSSDKSQAAMRKELGALEKERREVMANLELGEVEKAKLISSIDDSINGVYKFYGVETEDKANTDGSSLDDLGSDPLGLGI